VLYLFRPHSQLRITGVNTITDLRSQGVLNLIDLAGSERIDKSGAAGARLEETKNINKSLSWYANSTQCPFYSNTEFYQTL
jgi:hypothetical protein